MPNTAASRRGRGEKQDLGVAWGGTMLNRMVVEEERSLFVPQTNDELGSAQGPEMDEGQTWHASCLFWQHVNGAKSQCECAAQRTSPRPLSGIAPHWTCNRALSGLIGKKQKPSSAALVVQTHLTLFIEVDPFILPYSCPQPRADYGLICYGNLNMFARGSKGICR
ncbi:hypothetical protein B0H10DRAFT_2203965 [Mycena sp. CBHHK59/15]|nr:hypothetical protein B0H10DRAFT_2203965 [Mycena sp. CBHHK59/15]